MSSGKIKVEVKVKVEFENKVEDRVKHLR